MENDLQIAKQAKKLLPKLKVIFMGLANEMEKEEFVCQHSEVDYFLVGEYEDTLLELVQKIEKKRSSIVYLDVHLCETMGLFLDSKDAHCSLTSMFIRGPQEISYQCSTIMMNPVTYQLLRYKCGLREDVRSNVFSVRGLK